MAFELAINLPAAQALEIAVGKDMLVRADEPVQ